MHFKSFVLCATFLFVSSTAFPLSNLERSKKAFYVSREFPYNDGTSYLRLVANKHHSKIRFHPEVKIPNDTLQIGRFTQVIARVDRVTDDVLWAHLVLDISSRPTFSLDKDGNFFVIAENERDSRDIMVKRITKGGELKWSRRWSPRPWLGITIDYAPVALSSAHPSLIFIKASTEYVPRPRYPTDAAYLIAMRKSTGTWAPPLRLVPANVTHRDPIQRFSQANRVACATTADWERRDFSRTALACATYNGRAGRLLNLGIVNYNFEDVEVLVEDKAPGRPQAVYTVRREYLTRPNGVIHDELEFARRNANSLRPYRWTAGSWAVKRIRLPYYEHTWGMEFLGMRYVKQSHSVAVFLRTKYNTTRELLPIKGGYRMKWARITNSSVDNFYWLLQFSEQQKPRFEPTNPISIAKTLNYPQGLDFFNSSDVFGNFLAE